MEEEIILRPKYRKGQRVRVVTSAGTINGNIEGITTHKGKLVYDIGTKTKNYFVFESQILKLIQS